MNDYECIVPNILPLPGEIRSLKGIEVYGGTVPLAGAIGGDHLIYEDFKERYDLPARIRQGIAEGKPDVAANLERWPPKAGIAVVDASGHPVTDAVLAARLRQAFLLW